MTDFVMTDFVRNAIRAEAKIFFEGLPFRRFALNFLVFSSSLCIRLELDTVKLPLKYAHECKNVCVRCATSGSPPIRSRPFANRRCGLDNRIPGLSGF